MEHEEKPISLDLPDTNEPLSLAIDRFRAHEYGHWEVEYQGERYWISVEPHHAEVRRALKYPSEKGKPALNERQSAFVKEEPADS